MVKSLSFQDPPSWFKTQLEASGYGHSLPLPHADKRFCHPVPQNSPPPLWPGGLNLPPAKAAAVSANGQSFSVIHHPHVSSSQRFKETPLSDHPGATLAVTATPPELGHSVNDINQNREMSFSRIIK